MQRAGRDDGSAPSQEIGRIPNPDNSTTPRVFVVTGDVAVLDSGSWLSAGAADVLNGPVTLLVVSATDGSDSVPQTDASTARSRLTVDEPGRRICWDGRSLALTDREFSLLSSLARSPGKACAYKELVAAAWGGEYRGYADSLRSAVKRLRRKLQEAGVTATIEAVRGFGYRIDLSTSIELAGA